MSEPDTKPDAPKKRGRPIGSKTKNRLQEISVLVPNPIRRPMHYTMKQAAAELGISHDTLHNRSKEHRIYEPAARIARARVVYTDLQVQLISLVMREKITADMALEYMELIESNEINDLRRRATGVKV